MPLHTLRRGALYFSVPCLHARAHPKGASTWRGVACRRRRRVVAAALMRSHPARTGTYDYIYTTLYQRTVFCSLTSPSFFLLFFTTILLFFINRTALDETCSALHVHRITSQWSQNLYVFANKYLDL